MSLLVHRENQNLLWNVINKNKIIVRFFNNISQQEQYSWFQNTMRTFHNKYQNQSVDVNQLSAINREIIQFMIQDAGTYFQPVSYQNEGNNENFGEPYKKESKKDEYLSDFEKRQQLYENMNKKDTPKEVNFAIEKDENQQNVEELIKKQQEQRNLDLQVFGSQQLEINQKIDNDRVRLEVEENTNSFVKIPIENFENFIMQQEELSAYKNKVSTLSRDVEYLKDTIKVFEEMVGQKKDMAVNKERVDILFKELEDIKKILKNNKTE